MKTIRRISNIILIFALFVEVFYGGDDVVAVTKFTLHKRYISRIKSYQKRYDFSDGNVYFGFYDINHDGIDECLIVGKNYSQGENTFKTSGGTDCAVYTLYKGKIRKVVYSLTGGGTWGGVYFSKSKKTDIVNIGRFGTEYMHHTFQKLRKGKLITIGTAQKELSDNGNKFIYKVNGKKTTEKKYQSYCSKMFWNAGGVKLKKVTNKNLKMIK